MIQKYTFFSKCKKRIKRKWIHQQKQVKIQYFKGNTHKESSSFKYTHSFLAQLLSGQKNRIIQLSTEWLRQILEEIKSASQYEDN